MDAKKIVSGILLVIICIVISKMAWCDEIRNHSRQTGNKSDQTDSNKTSEAFAIKDSVGKTLAILQKGNINRNFLAQTNGINPVNLKLPRKYEPHFVTRKPFPAQNLRQIINMHMAAPGGMTPTAAFDTTPEKQAAT